MKNINLTLIIVLLFPIVSKAQDSAIINTVQKQWFDKFSIRGYAQVRYNTLETKAVF